MLDLIPHRAARGRTSLGGVLSVLGLVIASWLGAGCLDDEGARDVPGDPVVEDETPTVNETVPAVEVLFRLGGVYPANSVFEPARVEVAAFTPLNVTFTNSDLNPMGKHDWALEEIAKTDTVGVGVSATVAVGPLEPGEYAYFCSVPTHRDRGMEGLLVVA